MNLRFRSIRHLPMATASLVLTAAVILAWWPYLKVQAIQDSEDFPSPFGLTRDQTARLTLLNIGETAVVGPEYRFLDARGNLLAQSADRIVIFPGQFRSFDFGLPDPPPGIVDIYGRAQVRAVVSALGGPDTKNLRVSVEVFDNTTGKTSFIISPPPD